MIKKIVSILICITLFATVLAVAQPETNREITDGITPTSTHSAQQPILAPGDILIDFDAQTATGETGSLGVEWDGQYFWSSCRGLVNPPHKFFKWDINGNLVATYNQPAQATTAWGIRDLAFDGTYLYGGSEDGFWKIDPATGTSTLMFASIAPMTLIRALEWVPSEGMFYTGSFALGWYKFTPDGAQKIPIPNPGLTGVYGMGYDDMNDTIWVFDQIGTPGTVFYEYNYHTQALTGKTWVVPMLTGLTAQIAGGCFYATDCISGKAVLGGMVQGTALDRIFVMELRIANLPPDTPAAPSGPDDGSINIEYEFTASTTDPDGDNISYMFDWGDSNNSGWVGPYASGTPAHASYMWAATGDYQIKVKAKDENGGESNWSLAHTISIVAGPILKIENITGGLFKIKATIRNIGEGAANNINWSIKLTGGLVLLGKDTSDLISTIASGGEQSIASKLIIGFGKTVITVTATAPDNSATKQQNATILLFFIIIK